MLFCFISLHSSVMFSNILHIHNCAFGNTARFLVLFFEGKI
jgi:hypothetical protein